MQGKGPRRITVLPAAATDETLGLATLSPGYALNTFVIESYGVTSSGVITIEEASWGIADNDYSGSWSAITTVNASDVNTGSATGTAQKFVHVSSTANAYVRPRISTAIGGGGTITVYLLQEGN